MLYGANNLGKSTQMELLEREWRQMGRLGIRMKYSVYNLPPTGPIINAMMYWQRTMRRD